MRQRHSGTWDVEWWERWVVTREHAGEWCYEASMRKRRDTRRQHANSCFVSNFSLFSLQGSRKQMMQRKQSTFTVDVSLMSSCSSYIFSYFGGNESIDIGVDVQHLGNGFVRQLKYVDTNNKASSTQFLW